MKTRGASVAFVALMYVVIGLATAELAGHAATPQGVKFWRLAAWLSSAAIFAGHVLYDRRRGNDSSSRTAWSATLAVMLAVFALALLGPVRAHWNAADFRKSALLSVVLWPVLTGIPAFVLSLAAGSLLNRWRPATNHGIDPHHRKEVT